MSVDSTASYAEADLDLLKRIVRTVLEQQGVVGHAGLTEEFCRQLLWMSNHLSKISTETYCNPFWFTFDNKHRYAQEVRSWSLARSSFGPVLIWEFGRYLTAMLRAFLRKSPRTIPVAHVDRFDFGWSHNEFGLQAADLFANLIYNVVRYEAGIRNARTKLKATMLKDIVPGFCLEPNVASALTRESGDISFGMKSVLSTMQLEPA